MEWTQLAGHTPRHDLPSQMCCPRKGMSSHIPRTRPGNRTQKKKTDEPAKMQDSNPPFQPPTHHPTPPKKWRRQLRGPPKPPARHRASFIPTRSDLHAAGGAEQTCAREPPNWGPSRRLILGALRARECCARTKLTNGSCSCAKIGEFGSDHAVIGLGGGGRGLYGQEKGGACWLGWMVLLTL